MPLTQGAEVGHLVAVSIDVVYLVRLGTTSLRRQRRIGDRNRSSGVAALVILRTPFVIDLVGVLRARQRRAPALAARIDGKLGRLDGVSAEERPEGHAKKTRFLRRRHADALYLSRQGLDLRGTAVLSWSGMSGVITLAIAQTLPEDVPHRAELILIAFAVTLVTLVAQGSTLPILIRALGVRGTTAEQQRREFARLAEEFTAAGHALLDSATARRSNGTPFSPSVVKDVRDRSTAASLAVVSMLDDPDPDGTSTQHRELRRLLLEGHQNALLDARASGAYDSHTIEKAQHFLDAETTRRSVQA